MRRRPVIVLLALALIMLQSLPMRAIAAGGDSKRTTPEGYVDRWGYMDKGGRLTIAPRFADAKPFSEGLAAVQVGGTWGYIDRSGRFAIKPSYIRAGSFSEGLAVVQEKDSMVSDWAGGNAYLIDRSGRKITALSAPGTYKPASWISAPNRIAPGWWEALGDLREGRAAVLAAQGMSDGFLAHAAAGFVDRPGKAVIGLKYGYARAFSEGLAAVNTDDRDHQKWGYIDSQGAMAIPPQFHVAHSFSDGLAFTAAFDQDYVPVASGTWSYIDHSGKAVLSGPIEWYAGSSDEVDFHEGLAATTRRSEDGCVYSYMDKSGRTVIMPKYGYAERFSEGLAFVTQDSVPPGYGDSSTLHQGVSAYIDRIGKKVIVRKEMVYGLPFSEGLAAVQIGMRAKSSVRH